MEHLPREAEHVDGVASERGKIDRSRCDCAEPDEEIFGGDTFGDVFLAMKRPQNGHGDFGDTQTIVEDSRDSVEVVNLGTHGSSDGRFGVEETVYESQLGVGELS